MGFAIFVELFKQTWFHTQPVGAKGVFYHAGPAIRVDHAFQRLIGLKSYNQLMLLINVTWREAVNAAEALEIHTNSAAADFVLNQLIDLIPKTLGSF